jgi:hypothetical protein
MSFADVCPVPASPFPGALTAKTDFPSPPEYRVFFGEFVKSVLTHLGLLLPVVSQHVFGWGDRTKVHRVHAVSDPAHVVNLCAIRDRTNKGFVCPPVSANGSPIDHERGVTVRGQWAFPEPAGPGSNLNRSGETFSCVQVAPSSEGSRRG